MNTEDWPPPRGVVDLAFLMLVDRRVREELIVVLREAFAGADGSADDYTLAAPREGE